MAKYHNPYPGIRPFRTEESHLFFGREKNISEIREKLKCGFLSIVGTSGSGKSSLVRAGLIPSLLNDGYFVGTFRPQGDPIKNLIDTLMSKEGLGRFLPDNFIDGMGENEIWQIADYYKASGQELPLVLVVDQFEEIFRYNTGHSKEKAISIRFVDLLIEAISQQDCPIYIVITLRSEFLGRCAEFHGLTEWINRGQYLVPRFNQSQFKRVILGFKDLGEYKDVKMSSELVSKLLSDIGDDMDQLPVLQHSLMRTWHEWEIAEDEELDIRHYTATGEMSASVSNHAESIFKELKYQGLEKETRLIFQRITETDYESNKVRNPTKLSTLIELNGGKKDDVIKIIDAFRAEARNFLRPDYQIELQPDTMVDVAHESLIRQWRKLGKWMREEAENAREYQLINLRRENQETEGFLLNPRLAISNYWWLAKNPNVTWASRYHNLNSFTSKNEHKKIFTENEKFLEASLEEQDRIDETNKSELERKKEQQFQRITYLTIGLVVIALILALFSKRNQVLKDNALQSAQIATIEAQQADSARLMAETASKQAQREKAISDSLQVEATNKTFELIEANLIADDLKNQAIEGRQLAESRSLDARIAEIEALILESRAKANEIDANILKLTSEYKEKIEEAKKQALVSIILDDNIEQKNNAVASFEKFDQYNKMLMGLRGPILTSEARSIEYYVKSIDSVRTNLQRIITRANYWIREIDPEVPDDYQTFDSRPDCILNLNVSESTMNIVIGKLDSLENVKTSYEATCKSVDEVRTEREWEKSYPVENHRALLESYNNSFSTEKVDITFEELSTFLGDNIEINFNVSNSPKPWNPKFMAAKGINQVAYSDGQENLIINDGNRIVNIPLGSGSIKFIKILPNKLIAIGKLGSVQLYDYSGNPEVAFTFETGKEIINIDLIDNVYIGLNKSGDLLTWDLNGKILNKFSPLPQDLITSFDCMKIPDSDHIIFAVGTSAGRVHILDFNGSVFLNTQIQMNRLYGGEEPTVKTVRFSPDGYFLATASSRQLDLWPLAHINKSNNLESIFNSDISSEQISPIPVGRNESIQTSRGLTGISFGRNGDFLMYANNTRIQIKPVNMVFMCQSLGSDYCAESSLN
jgi:WD40 repeat protein